MNNEIDKLNERIGILENKMDKIIDLMENSIKPNCEKMSYHIDFIEKIYQNVKNPLNSICNLFSRESTIDNNFSIEYLE